LARGALFLTSYEVPTREFADEYSAAFGEQPGRYTMETYELATVMIAGIAEGAVEDRGSMAGWFDQYSGHGAVRYFSWDASGELVLPEVWVHEIA
jgi:branched-chain amino acid transport system substrate-binding protein